MLILTLNTRRVNPLNVALFFAAGKMMVQTISRFLMHDLPVNGAIITVIYLIELSKACSIS